MSQQPLQWTVGPEDARTRVDKFLVKRVPAETRAALQRAVTEGRVLVDGASARSSDKLRSGMIVSYSPGRPALSEAVPDFSVEVDVVHEDAELLVLNKPAGLVVHPGAGHSSGTLVNGLLARGGFEAGLADDSDAEGYLRPGIVHRIDKDTSGLLVVAKTAAAREGLKALFQRHDIVRRYDALTYGVPDVRCLETWHGRDPRHRRRFSSMVKDGKRAVTHVVRAEALAGGRAALVQCRLETGRTHQIRVHLSQQSKTPLLGDTLYQEHARRYPDIVTVADELGRHALHAAELGFDHPITGKKLFFETPLPDDMAHALQTLRDLNDD